jgi:short-subunit dehydrogenase
MKTALVTGASSGIGKAIAIELENSGYRVIGIGRKDIEYLKGRYIKCDIRDSKRLDYEIKSLLKNQTIDILINSAGVGIFKPHEEISLDKISELIDINLKAPIILTNILLRELKKNRGHIINISSIEATRNSRFSALYSATKSGLRAFSLSLFEELRRADVKVTNINPDITKTPFFDNLGFKPSPKENTHILASEIANSVLFILNTPSVVTELTIRPQKVEILKKSSKKSSN